MKHWTDALSYTPCADALKWLRTQPDAATAWAVCQRGDWMLSHAGKLSGEHGSDARRPLVLAACACARLALPYVIPGETRPLEAIETAERWARGGADAPSIDMVRAAARNAYAAAYAAYATDADAAATDAYAAAADAYAAYAAAAAAAYAADADAAAADAYAAYAAAAYAAYAARIKALCKCADDVRKIYPQVPQ